MGIDTKTNEVICDGCRGDIKVREEEILCHKCRTRMHNYIKELKDKIAELERKINNVQR